jgi:hypothetical protein
MGTDIDVWQMVIAVEHSLRVDRAARLGTLGPLPHRPWLLLSLFRGKRPGRAAHPASRTVQHEMSRMPAVE